MTNEPTEGVARLMVAEIDRVLSDEETGQDAVYLLAAYARMTSDQRAEVLSLAHRITSDRVTENEIARQRIQRERLRGNVVMPTEGKA